MRIKVKKGKECAWDDIERALGEGFYCTVGLLSGKTVTGYVRTDTLGMETLPIEHFDETITLIPSEHIEYMMEITKKQAKKQWEELS
ncbi:MAG: hypothetical protein ACTSYG_08505 [Candidatus Heimdallarchaeota archaeon]